MKDPKNQNESRDLLENIKQNTEKILDGIGEGVKKPIWHWLRDIWNKLLDTPNIIYQKFKQTPHIKLIEAILGFVENIKKMIEGLARLFSKTETMNMTTVNQSNFETFVRGLKAVVQAANNIVERKQLPVAKLHWGDVDWMFTLIPNFILNIASIVPNAMIKDWHLLPDQLADVLNKLEEKETNAEELGDWFIWVKAVGRSLSLAVGTWKDCVPRDQKVSASIIGNGLGATIAASPTHIALSIFKLTIDFVMVVVELFHDAEGKSGSGMEYKRIA